ncbi:MAG: SGNH/GDSL hydrolase family protein [Planctomycetes bacterium]|nr:SGNH/GDSL hydrolase family protein [Planctomycetota bacterium]
MDKLRRISLLILRIDLAAAAIVVLALLIASMTPWGIAEFAPQQQRAGQVALLVHAAALFLLAIAFVVVRRAAHLPARLPQLLLALSLLVSLVSCDLLVAIGFPPWEPELYNFMYHPVRGWTNVPGSRSLESGIPVVMDAMGMRTDEESPTTQRAGDGPSILFVGDSLSQGWHVRYRDAFGVQAVEILKKRYPGRDLVPLLGATAGYDTAQEAHWLEDIGLKLKPRVVVLQFCLNDVFASFNPDKLWEQRFANGWIHPGPPLCWSGIGRAIYTWKHLARTSTGLLAEGARVEWFGVSELLKRQESSRVRDAWDRTMKSLDRIESTCRKAGIPLLLIVFPVADQILDANASALSQARLKAWASQHGVPFVDVLPEYLRRYPDRKESHRMFCKDLTHPTVEGHRVAGELLALELEQMPVVRSILGR